MTDKDQKPMKQPEEQKYIIINPVVDTNDVACSPEFSDSCKIMDDDE